MSKLKMIVSDLMVLVIGMVLGSFMHSGLKTIVLGIALVGILHVVWDIADSKTGSKKSKSAL